MFYEEPPQPPRLQDRPARTSTLAETSAALPDDVAAAFAAEAGSLTLISGAQGVGKTKAVIDALTRECHQVLFAFPTRDKAKEAYDDYQKAAGEAAPDAILHRSRSAKLLGTQDRYCVRHRSAALVARAGLPVRAVLCTSCPAKPICPHVREREKLDGMIRDGFPFVLFGTHELAFGAAPPNFRPDLVIVDEATSNLGVAQSQVNFSELRSIAGIDPDRFASPLHRDAVVALAEALILAGDRHLAPRLQVFRGVGITPELVDNAVAALVNVEIETAIRKGLQAYQFGAAYGGSDARALGKSLLASGYPALGRLARFAAVLRKEIAQPRDDANALRLVVGADLEPASYAFAELRRPAYQLASTLLLDGTADADQVAAVFGKAPVHLIREAERRYKLVQVTSSASDQSFLGEKIWQQGVRRPDPYAAAKLDALIKAMNREAEAKGGIFVCGNKSVIDVLRADSRCSKALHFGHFGNIKGSNQWENLNHAIIIGAQRPPLMAMEQIGRAYSADDPAEFESIAGRPELEGVDPKLREGRDRSSNWDYAGLPSSPTHPNRWVRAALDQRRRAEVLQAIDRIRPHYKSGVDLTVTVLGFQDHGLVPDEVSEFKDWARGGTRLEMAWRKAGFLPLSGSKLAWLHPELWANERTARRDLEEPEVKQLIDFKGKEVRTFPYKECNLTSPIGKCPHLGPAGSEAIFAIDFKEAGAGKRSVRALVRAASQAEARGKALGYIGAGAKVTFIATIDAAGQLQPVPEDEAPSQAGASEVASETFRAAMREVFQRIARGEPIEKADINWNDPEANAEDQARRDAEDQRFADAIALRIAWDLEQDRREAEDW